MKKGEQVIVGIGRNIGRSLAFQAVYGTSMDATVHFDLEALELAQQLVDNAPNPMQELMDALGDPEGEERDAMKQAHYMYLYGGSSDLVRSSKEPTSRSERED